MAMDLYRKSAEMGYPRAMFNLGFMYTDVEGVDQDLAEGYKWYSKAAEAGNLIALYRVAVMDEEAVGSPRTLRRPSQATRLVWTTDIPRQGIA